MNKNSQQSTVNSPQPHKTVLRDEAVDGLKLKKADTAVDATVGMGGHAERLIEAVGEKGTVLMIDADPASIAASREHLKDAKANLIFMHGNFRNIGALAREAGVTQANGIVFDLGWHSGQLAGGKGLSFQIDEPLVMTLGSGYDGVTARDIIAGWDEVEIARIIREYGEERFAGRIARTIVERRRKRPIETSTDLAEVISSAVPGFYRRGRLHPATRTFQALRIAVNDELEALKEGLAAAIELLAPQGRVAVISFHSLEDRIVKHSFRAAEEAGQGSRVTKKPLIPGREETATNPRARSAKLRIFEKS